MVAVLRGDVRAVEAQAVRIGTIRVSSRRPEVPVGPTKVERTISPIVVASKGNGQRKGIDLKKRLGV